MMPAGVQGALSADHLIQVQVVTHPGQMQVMNMAPGVYRST